MTGRSDGALPSKTPFPPVSKKSEKLNPPSWVISQKCGSAQKNGCKATCSCKAREDIVAQDLDVLLNDLIMEVFTRTQDLST